MPNRFGITQYADPTDLIAAVYAADRQLLLHPPDSDTQSPAQAQSRPPQPPAMTTRTKASHRPPASHAPPTATNQSTAAANRGSNSSARCDRILLADRKVPECTNDSIAQSPPAASGSASGSTSSSMNVPNTHPSLDSTLEPGRPARVAARKDVAPSAAVPPPIAQRKVRWHRLSCFTMLSRFDTDFRR